MLRRSTSTRTALAVLAAGLGMTMVAAVAPASAAPASTDAPAATAASSSLKASGPFAAAADASLLTLDIPALSPSILPQTNVDLARSQANVESDKDVDTARAGVQRSSAVAGTTGNTSVLGAPLSIQKNQASAPESQSNENVLIPLDLSPLLNLPVIRTSAAANWVSDTECVAADKPLSVSDQALADLTLLGIGAGQSVAELSTDNSVGAVDTTASTYLASIPGSGDPRAVQSRVQTQVTSVNLLNGLAPGLDSAIQVKAVQSPHYVVSASGLPGGASVTGADPAVEVDLAGQDLITLDTANQTKDATITDLVLGDLLNISTDGLLTDLVTDLGLGALGDLTKALDDGLTTVLNELQPIVRLSIPVQKSVSADGTQASVKASLLRVEILPPKALGATAPLAAVVNQILGALGADLNGPLLSLDVAPVGASAVAPAGGIKCGDDTNPLRELNKHASATEVAPNGTFEYNIAVPNRGPCKVTDTKVTDVITGPGFQVIDTEPKATVDGGKVSWDLGTLEVNETRNLTITVKVAGDAPDNSSFDDVVTASGKCDGRAISQDDRVDNIPVVKRDFTGPCNVQFSNKDASHIQVFPGETFSYFVHAYNTGGEPCTDVTVTDTLDHRLSFVSCNKACSNSGDKVVWKLSSLGSGSSAIFSVVVKVNENASGVLANSAVIAPKNGKSTTVRTTGPTIGPDSIPKDPAPANRRPLPKTGATLPVGLAAGLGIGALALLAVRRRATLV